MTIRRSREVEHALAEGRPVVALETAVLTHGLPRPRNLAVAREVEAAVREAGAVPATIGVLDGQAVVGLSSAEMERLSGAADARKISVQGLAAVLAVGGTGGTTVAATAHLAVASSIDVFATGGIGGVHRGGGQDVSGDLAVLGTHSLVVVCAGAKIILDLPATREALETAGVPMVGMGTDEMPGFHTASTGLPVDCRVESAVEVAEILRAQRGLGLSAAVLVVVPPPSPLPADEVEGAVEEALALAASEGVRGDAVTPFLLRALTEATGGSAVEANAALLIRNATVAAEIARALAGW